MVPAPKAVAAHRGLTAIVLVSAKPEECEAGKALVVVKKQLRGSMRSISATTWSLPMSPSGPSAQA